MLVAIILARSGSKGLVDKNMLFLKDKPLSCYTIDAALSSKIFDKIIFSTDSKEYITNLKKIYGNKIEFIVRSTKLTSDTASSYDSIEFILNKFKGNINFCLLQPTSPLRNEIHIKDAYKLFNKKNMVVSFTQADKPNFLYMEMKNGKLDNDLNATNFRRQDYAKKYYPNGAIYFANKDTYLKHKTFFIKQLTNMYIMNKIDSIDIDTIDDFNLALSVIRNRCQFNFKDRVKEKISNNKFSYDSNIVLGDSLVENWPLPMDYINLGISGISSKEFVNTFPKNKKISCNKLIILIGTNDFKIGIKFKETVENIDTLIKHFDFKKLQVLSIPFTLYRNDRSNAAFNNNLIAINDLLKSKYKNCFFDLNNLICKDNKLLLEYTIDGLHLNDKCYKLINKELL